MATRTADTIFPQKKLVDKTPARDYQVTLPAAGDVRSQTVYGWPGSERTGTLAASGKARGGVIRPLGVKEVIS